MPKPLTGEPSASRHDTNRSSRDPLLREPTIASRPSGPAMIRDGTSFAGPAGNTIRPGVAGSPKVSSGVPSALRPTIATSRLSLEPGMTSVLATIRSRRSGRTTMPVPMSLSVEGAIEMISFPSSENPASNAPSARRARMPMSAPPVPPCVRPTV